MKGRRIILLTVLAALLAGAAGCSKVHEWPEKGQEVDPTEIRTKIRLKLTLAVELGEVVTKAAPAIDVDKETPDKYDRRYIVQIFNEDGSSVPAFADTVFTAADAGDTLTLNTVLHARKYVVYTWVDYILKGTGKDLYYTTTDGLQAVHVPSRVGYMTGTDYKDGMMLSKELDLTEYADQWNTTITIEEPLTRPFAKITLLANDLEDYAYRVVGPETDLPSVAAGLSVEVKYNGYFPTGLNVLTGRLNDSETGYSFNYRPRYPFNYAEQVDKTIIGSDYVLVNGESSSVTISVIVRNKAGEFVNQVDNIVVPIYRSKETVVVGRFLTREYVPGVGIDPGFDGEFNVYV